MWFVGVQQNPQPNNVEYYYFDKLDEKLKSRVDAHYSENYDEEMHRAQETNKTFGGPFSAYVPELRDYTLRAEFQDPFRAMPEVSVTAAVPALPKWGCNVIWFLDLCLLPRWLA